MEHRIYPTASTFVNLLDRRCALPTGLSDRGTLICEGPQEGGTTPNGYARVDVNPDDAKDWDEDEGPPDLWIRSAIQS